MRGLRVLASGLVAAAITFVLFLFMYELISMGSDQRVQLEAISGIHFGPVDIPDEVATKSRRETRKPAPPREPPPQPRMRVASVERIVPDLPEMDMPELDVPLSAGAGVFMGNFRQVDRAAEGDIIPIVRISPVYPRDAAINGIEGWVKLEFTITETGTVRSPKVVDSMPPRVFNREAIRAILKWKFKPRVVNGVAVERRATQTIDFTLEGG
jgi:protein TonB